MDDTTPTPPALTPEAAEALLAAAPHKTYATAALRESRAFVEELLARGVPAAVRQPDACGCGKPGGGCAPKFEVVVREADVPHVAALQRGQWDEALAREGLQPVRVHVPEEGELPCPACGTAAPLVEGACSDCGLQLE